jgi:hypothetical protein
VVKVTAKSVAGNQRAKAAVSAATDHPELSE